MPLLLENPAPYYAFAAVGLTTAAIVFATTRSSGSLLAMAAVMLLAVGGLWIESAVVTPREEVEQTIEDLASNIEANDLLAVLAHCLPGSNIEADAQKLMPRFTVRKMNLTSGVDVRLGSETPEATTATATASVFVDAVHRGSGVNGKDLSRVTFELTRRGERWLIESYEVENNRWRRGAAELERR